jgi:hypothetical protein
MKTRPPQNETSTPRAAFVQAAFFIGERLIFLIPPLTTIVLLSLFWRHEPSGNIP